MFDFNNLTIKKAHEGLKDKLFSALELTEELFKVYIPLQANSCTVLQLPSKGVNLSPNFISL